MTIKKNIKAKKAIRTITGPISFGEMLYSFRILGISKQELCNIEKGRKFVSVDRALQDQLTSAGIAGEVEIRI